MFGADTVIARLSHTCSPALASRLCGSCVSSWSSSSSLFTQAKTASMFLSHPWSDSSLTAATRVVMDGKDRWRWAWWSAAELAQLCWDDSGMCDIWSSYFTQKDPLILKHDLLIVTITVYHVSSIQVFIQVITILSLHNTLKWITINLLAYIRT